MTADFNAEIVRAAEEWKRGIDEVRAPEDSLPCSLKPLFRAVAAKREAARPKLLTKEEAHSIYANANNLWCPERLQAVLDSAHARAVPVIEAKLREVAAQINRDAESVMPHIRAALGVKP